MARQAKATRKFEKNHLKSAIDKRKAVKKIKQRNAKGKPMKSVEQLEANREHHEAEKTKKHEKRLAAPEIFEDMSVEKFFQGGFEVPKEPAKLRKKIEKKKQSAAADAKTGDKRKRPEQAIEETLFEEDDEEDEEEVDDEGDDSEEEGAGKDVADHQDQLAALKEKDPEFFKYLQENDTDLLDFTMAERDGLSDVDDLESADDTIEGTQKKKKSKKSDDSDDENMDVDDAADKDTSVMLKKVDVEKWAGAMQDQHSLRALRQVVLAFRAAAHVGEDDGTTYKYTITDPDVYHDLLVLAMTGVPKVLNHHIPVKELPNGKVRLAVESKKYRTLTPLLKSHCASLLHLLSTLTDSATTKLLLNSTLSLIPYLLSFRRFLRDFTRQVVDIWSSATSEESTKVTAYLVLRRVVVVGDSGLREACLKTAYNGFLKGCRGTTQHSLSGINLVKNGGVDLFGVDEEEAYMLGFGYVRQLAVHLRGSITNNSKDSYRTVYNWQYVHSLDFWSRVLSTFCDGMKEAENGKESPLRPLIYPLVQVTLGAARLIPTSQYFPLRLHLIRSLIRLSRHTGTFIPLSSLILEMLTSNEMKKPPKASTLRPLDFNITIRAPKSYLRTRTYQDGVGEQIVDVLSEFFVLYTKSIAFPELTVPTTVLLRRFIKKASIAGSGNRNAKVNNAFVGLVQKLEANGKWIEEKRRGVDFAPNKREEVDGFLKEVDWVKTPLGGYVVSQRKVREERRKILEEAAAKENEKEKKKRAKSNGRRGRDEEDDEESDVEIEGLESSDDEQEDGDEDMEE